jgi:membrane peptidoglycan carboxypeptidase
MEHIQQLTLTWLRPPATRERWPVMEPVAPPELPPRERVRKLAELHHRQLLQAKQRTGSHYEMLRAQTEALRQFTRELTPEQSDVFMNMYTEESSAVERDWMSKQAAYRVNEPLSPTLVNTLTFAVTVAAIIAAIYYAV